MTRPLRIQFSGAVYHIMSRGNNKHDIFRSDQDKIEFLNILKDVSVRNNWEIYSYCLMNNHYHILIETVDGVLSQGMSQLNGIYTQRFNRKYGLSGHIFQGRYKSILVEKGNYLLELIRYILLNPVRAGITEDQKEYIWTSFSATVSETESSVVSSNKVLSLFQSGNKKSLDIFQAFINEGLDDSKLIEKSIKSGFYGSKEFIKNVIKLGKGEKRIKAISKIQRFADRPSLQEIFGKFRSKESRNESIYKAHIKYAYKLKQIADFLNIHYSTVSKAFIKINKQKNY